MNLPLDFINRIRRTEGFPEPQAFIDSLDTDAPTSIRINRKKPIAIGANYEPITWTETGHYLSMRPPFISDPLFHAGTYYVQEASSMVIEEVWKQTMLSVESPIVLDLCAAPGGKSTLLTDLLPPDGAIICNEVIRSRSSILRENMWRWNSSRALVTNNDPADFRKTKIGFDFIWVDAPCSGEGMFRKDIQARGEWSQSNVDLCASRQERIVSDIWDNLKVGGILGYSTCTYNDQENDGILEKVLDLGGEIVQIDLDKTFGFCLTLKGGYQAYPHKLKGEGFYFCVVRKTEGTDYEALTLVGNKKSKKKKKSHQQKATNNFDEFKQYVEPNANSSWFEHRKVIYEATNTAKSLLDSSAGLNVISAGAPVAENTGKRYELHPGLAFNPNVNTSTIKTEELNLSQAIDYLRKLDPGVRGEQGLRLFTYRGFGLGFGKVLNNRVNNHYPKNWRILKTWDHSEDWSIGE